MHVYDIGLRLDTHPPYLVEDHGPSDNAARVSAQILQKHELLWSQIQGPPAAQSLASQQVEFKIEHSQASGLRTRGTLSL